MTTKDLHKPIQPFDDRRDLAVFETQEAALEFSIKQFLAIANQAIAKKGLFTVALSGGSTPKAIYQGLSSEKYRKQLDWSRALLFWGDERCVPKDHPDSNYHMAMNAGFATLPILSSNIFPMPTEGDLVKAAAQYEKQIKENVPNSSFDLMMLGMGEDGHTASLFPFTKALQVSQTLVTPNFVPEKDCWRMTLTYGCINQSQHISIYVLGKNKQEMVKKVLQGLYQPDELPIQRVGTSTHKALWITDSLN